MYFSKFRRGLALFIILCLSISLAYGEDKKVLVVGESFPPFEFEKDGQVVGIDIDIARSIFEKMNIPVEFRIHPWKRAWLMAEKGEIDAILSTSWNENREAYLWFPKENMWTSQYVFFVHKEKVQPDFKGYQTVIKQNLKIGIIRGNSYFPSFWKAFPYKDGSTIYQKDASWEIMNEHLDVAVNAELNFKKLAGQRFDLFPMDKTVGIYMLEYMNLGDKVTYYENTLSSKPYFMPFIKKSGYPNIKHIAERFEQELTLLKQTANYQKYFDKWLK